MSKIARHHALDKGPRAPEAAPADQLGESSAIRIAILQREISAKFRQPKSWWWRTWSWVLLTLLALVAAGLAVAGTKGSYPHRLADALSLFPSGFPGRPERGESNLLTAGKYLAAFVSLFLTLTVIWAVYARGSTALRARLRHGHAVICGLGEKGLRSARAFRHQGVKVTCIDLDGGTDAADDMRARGAIVLEGDATQANLLALARADRATHVVCACKEDSVNARIAAQVARLAGGRRQSPVNVFVHIANPELSALLRAPALGLESARLQFFNIYDLWARALVDEAKLGRSGPEEDPPQVIVVGSTWLARSVVVSAAHQWHELNRDGGARIRITLVAPDANASCTALAARYPALTRVAELTSAEHALSSSEPADVVSAVGPIVSESVIVYLCLYDDAENLSLALQARQQLPEGARVLVPVTAWTGELAPLLLDPSGGIHAVGYSPTPDSFDLLRDSRREAMAREVHKTYRASDRPRAEADKPWDALPESLRESNRLQVDSMESLLRALWYELAPLYDWDAPAAQPSDAELETLAELEHLRWCAERRALGWQYGEVWSDGEKTHPDLVEWSQLSDSAREKDRQSVRAWAGILARAGFTLTRNPARERLAQLIHERHRRSRRAAGESEATIATLLPWDELSDEDRELNRTSADDISVKLSRIGCRVVSAWDSGDFSFSDDEIEFLAELEHERWARTRAEQGWQPGPDRDDAAKVHPDLVPWDELPPARRQIDREHVRAIPEVLSHVGLRIAREPGVNVRTLQRHGITPVAMAGRDVYDP